MRRQTFCALVLGIALGVAVPSLAVGAELLRPMIVGWERYFKITWSVAERHGRPVIEGRLTNDYGSGATRIQLLVEGLDQSGQILSQQVSWFGRTLGPFDTSYFEVPVREPAPAYRVSVFAWDRIESDDFRRRF
jgi:hypothetical protein